MSRTHRSKGVLVAMSAVTFLVLGLSGVAHAQPVAWSYPENLGDILNSTYNEDLPHLGPDGRSLYFISDRPGKGGFDIFVSRRFSPYDPWGAPRNLGPVINGSTDERGPCVSPDGHYLYFSSNRAGSKNGSQDLWRSYRSDTTNDFGWQAPENLGDGVNTNDPDFGAAYTEDQSGRGTLLFGRRVGGGQSDIYMSQRQSDGSFGDAVRVWQLSMPSADDLRPTVRLDGLELYFHSNRPSSEGHDLWVSSRPSTDWTWQFPQNVGPVVNTSDAELYPALSPDARTLVFSSNRPDSRGGNDLYISTRESDPWPYYDYSPH